MYAKESRTVKNWDAAWLIMNDRPEELEEYHALKKKNKLTGILAKDKETYSEYYEGLKDPKFKVEAETDWKRFCTLNAKCERLIRMQLSVLDIRETKMTAFKNSQDADKELEAAKDEEKRAAAQISNDHVVADEARMGVAELFPTIQMGFIATSVNGNECEDEGEARQVLPRLLLLMLLLISPHRLRNHYDPRQGELSSSYLGVQAVRFQEGHGPRKLVELTGAPRPKQVR